MPRLRRHERPDGRSSLAQPASRPAAPPARRRAGSGCRRPPGRPGRRDRCRAAAGPRGRGRPAARRTGCRPGSPAGRSARARSSAPLEPVSASSVGRSIVVPSAAAVIGTCTSQSRSSPRRVKTSCGATSISTYRSPAGPPPGPTSPWPASWIRVPLSTPERDLDRDRAPGPDPAVAGALAGTGWGSPCRSPRQVGHGRTVRTSPRNDRCTWVTSPRPRAGVAGDRLRALARCRRREQRWHTTAVSTLSSWVVPNAASASSTSSRISAS